MIKRCKETGNVKNCAFLGRLILTVNIPKKLDVAKFFIKDPNLSICKTTQQHNINPISA